MTHPIARDPISLEVQLRRVLAGAYDVDRELGGGGMSRVFAATEVALGRKVALKILPPELSAGLNPDRFRREIQLAATLQHPHIVPVHATGDVDGMPWFTMPLVEGESLRGVLRRGEMPVAEAVSILRDVARALAYAHGHGIVHRDIKPDNVLLSGRSAMVTDFGVAKALSEAANPGAALTATGIALGTPAYMSPEQAAADPNVDARADIYSFGVLAYEMLTGHAPFAGRTPQQTLAAHMTETPPTVASERPSVPEELSELVASCMAKRPADRPQRSEDVLQLLDAVSIRTTGMRAPTGTGPRSTPHQGSRPVRRVALATAALALVVIGAYPLRQRFGVGAPRIRAIAVLPFENQTGDPSQESFVSVAHGTLIEELGSISGLEVRSRTTAIAFRETRLTLGAIADSLKVDALVEGLVYRAGDTVRLKVSLFGVRPERPLWTHTYHHSISIALSALGDVARSIAGEVRVVLTAGEVRRLGRSRVIDTVAQQYFARGRDLVYRRDTASLRAAIAELREAIRRDPEYASAYASLALASALGANLGMIRDSVYGWYARALAASDRAMKLDSLNPEGFAVRGYLGLYSGAPADSTERFLRHALALRPNYSEAWGWLGQAIAVRQPREGIAAVDSALRLDPASVGMLMARHMVGFMIDSAKLVHEVAGPLAQLRRNLVSPAIYDGLALVELGRPEECPSITQLPRSILAVCLDASGRKAEARQLLAEEFESYRRAGFNISLSQLPFAYAATGDFPAAYRSLSLYFDRSPWFVVPIETHRLTRSVSDSAGVAFWRAVKAQRETAWSRVVREARSVVFP